MTYACIGPESLNERMTNSQIGGGCVHRRAGDVWVGGLGGAEGFAPRRRTFLCGRGEATGAQDWRPRRDVCILVSPAPGIYHDRPEFHFPWHERRNRSGGIRWPNHGICRGEDAHLFVARVWYSRASG